MFVAPQEIDRKAADLDVDLGPGQFVSGTECEKHLLKLTTSPIRGQCAERKAEE
jgi:hypothetical protein